MTAGSPSPSARSLRALDWLNVFLADVRDGVGPFLAIYLSASLHWDAAGIGLALSVATISTVLVQTPAGWLVDRLRQKRGLLVAGASLVGAGCLAMIAAPTLPTILTAQALIGAAGALFPPAVAAITLGLVGHRMMDRRVGRNEAFNHGGNVLAAGLAGLAGKFIGPEAIFVLVAAMGVGGVISVLRIRAGEIDHDRARGATEDDGDTRVAPMRELVGHRGLLVFSLSTVLFHFANAAMLPLIGQKLAEGKPDASLYMAACIIVAQLVMIPVAIWSGRLANSWGRRPVFLVGMVILPIRGFLYTLSDDPFYLVAVQALDGVGAGIFGVLVITIVADLTAGTGRFNLAQGALATATGVGASLSNLMTGFLVSRAGYQAGFLVLAGIAVAALLVFALFMPETRPGSAPDRPRPPAAS